MKTSVVIGRASLATAAALLLAASAAAQVVRTEAESFRVVTVVERLEHPWSLAFLPDGRMLVTERAGRLRIVGRDGKLVAQPVAGLPKIEEYGQGGLLDVALHPRFAENALVYLSFAERGDGGYGTAVLRGRLAGAGEDARLEGVEVIYRQAPKSRTGRHFGSRLVFDRAGFLYVTQGDRGEQDRAQKLDDLAGKVVRLHDDGRIPTDNPFVARAGARPEIFTLGNRNVQGAALHPVTGELWAHEHGPQGGDEVNVLRAGVNYGWPVITYGVNYGTGTKIGEGTSKPGSRSRCTTGCRRSRPRAWPSTPATGSPAGRAISSSARSATSCSCACASTARRWCGRSGCYRARSGASVTCVKDRTDSSISRRFVERGDRPPRACTVVLKS